MIVTCEQALRGTLAAGHKKEGGLGTTSLEFEYLHGESRCEMLVVGDDISNDVITLKWHVFSIFAYIRACFCFALIGGNLTAWLTGSHGRTGGGIQVASFASFFCPTTRAPWRAWSQAIVIMSRETTSNFEGNLSKLENYNTL